MRRFVIRKVLNGKVKINGKFYAPDVVAPQLEGKRFAFGLYPYYYSKVDFVSLWGTEKLYKAVDNDERYKEEWDKYVALCTKDGVFLWEWWHAR